MFVTRAQWSELDGRFIELLSTDYHRCAVCGIPDCWAPLSAGDAYRVPGRLCGDCQRSLANDERALSGTAARRLRETPKPPKDGYGRRVRSLPVLNPSFGLDDLTPRALARLVLRSKGLRRSFRNSPRCVAAAPSAAARMVPSSELAAVS